MKLHLSDGTTHEVNTASLARVPGVVWTAPLSQPPKSSPATTSLRARSRGRRDGVRPLLLLDVDGVLLPARPAPGFDRWVGETLRALAERFELVWATAWEHRANTLLAPRYGLDTLPVIELGSPAGGATYKLASVIEAVGDSALAWVDDDLNDDAFAWAESREAPTLLLRPKSTRGLAAGHVARLEQFAHRS